MKIVLATNNSAKVKEIKPFFEQIDMSLISLSDLGLYFEPREDGDTFEHNATQKASETLEFLRKNGHEDMAVLADDSGLCITALGNAPGVDSANFMGRETPYDIRNAHIISLLSALGTPDRTAKFVCVMACCYFSNNSVYTKVVTAHISGEIATKPAGECGFGYDPIFYLPNYGRTIAELSFKEKNKISHRGQALKLISEAIRIENFTH